MCIILYVLCHVVPPDPVTNLMASTVTETTVTITWTNNNVFEDNALITEARVDYFREGQVTQSTTVTVNSPATATVSALTPLTMYNISVVVTNVAGTSDPSSVLFTTLSLCN